MECRGTQYIQYPSRASMFKIWNLADLHIGAKACALEWIKKDIKEIRDDPYSFWIGGGDYAEYIGKGDKRFDCDAVADFITVSDLGRLGKVLITQVRDILEPIKHKCLGLLFGNHEKSYQKWQEQEHLHSWLCEELEVLNLGYSAFLDVVFVRNGKQPKIINTPVRAESSQKFRFHVHHGAGFATTPAGKLTRLIRFMTYFDADIFMLGHVHDQQGRREVQIAANQACDKLITKTKLGVISGSYLKTYKQGVTTYGEQKGYAPTVLGSAVVTIIPDKRIFKGEI
ncbi:MAG TPA: metallophosphoesterase [Desulfobacterales bacterium]|nr:metallophosphoesterase [Desulfobacterales bacterium]